MQDANGTQSSLLNWKIVGLVILPIRFVQGWIFWGGGSRRFIYDPAKLDPYSHSWMANKLQSAMPGAIMGVSHMVNFLLNHFILLYVAIIVFSLLELISGLALIAGCFTRAAGVVTALISILLMLLFGWQGSTCMDEWTMAVSNLSMGLVLALSGASIYSIDNLLIKYSPKLSNKSWFKYVASGPVAFPRLKPISLLFFVFTLLFTLLTYDYFRGAIISKYHPGPVSPVNLHLTLSDGQLNANGRITFLMYVDGGSPASPSVINRIELVDSTGRVLYMWDASILRNGKQDQIKNIFSYNQILIGEYGIVIPLSAKARITLQTGKIESLSSTANYQLQVYTINGARWVLPLTLK